MSRRRVGPCSVSGTVSYCTRCLERAKAKQDVIEADSSWVFVALVVLSVTWDIVYVFNRREGGALTGQWTRLSVEAPNYSAVLACLPVCSSLNSLNGNLNSLV